MKQKPVFSEEIRDFKKFSANRQYQKGLLDDGEHLEEFTLWAGYYEIKVDRETLLHKLSKERVEKLQAQASGGFVNIVPNEPTSTIAG